MKKAKLTKKALKGEVKIAIYDSAKDDSPLGMEDILTKVSYDPEKYELVSMDKSITPAGNFVMVLVYKQEHVPDMYSENDFETEDNLER